mmetsp:Transcript_25701/g.88012  ORF Transcript_25701/g.88012 Transcript_25701/m.88012 type:complete len:245 (-) Transcript_25701:2179-2913(-)
MRPFPSGSVSSCIASLARAAEASAGVCAGRLTAGLRANVRPRYAKCKSPLHQARYGAGFAGSATTRPSGAGSEVSGSTKGVPACSRHTRLAVSTSALVTRETRTFQGLTIAASLRSTATANATIPNEQSALMSTFIAPFTSPTASLSSAKCATGVSSERPLFQSLGSSCMLEASKSNPSMSGFSPRVSSYTRFATLAPCLNSPMPASHDRRTSLDDMDSTTACFKSEASSRRATTSPRVLAARR